MPVITKTALSGIYNGKMLSIVEPNLIHEVPKKVTCDEISVYAVNTKDHPIEIILQITGVSDMNLNLPVSSIPNEVVHLLLDSDDKVVILTKDEGVQITGFVNRTSD